MRTGKHHFFKFYIHLTDKIADKELTLDEVKKMLGLDYDYWYNSYYKTIMYLQAIAEKKKEEQTDVSMNVILLLSEVKETVKIMGNVTKAFKDWVDNDIDPFTAEDMQEDLWRKEMQRMIEDKLAETEKILTDMTEQLKRIKARAANKAQDMLDVIKKNSK